MAKDIVFVLHGIGKYEPGWMEDPSCAVPELRKAAANYPPLAGKPLEAVVEFVPILYDDVFQRIMSHWADLANGLSASQPVLQGYLQKTVKIMQGAGADDFAHTHAADVALYWGFKLFQQRVLLRVLSQMTRKIADSIAGPAGRPQYHVLAHSLGTAVAHDALQNLGTEAWLADLKTAQFDDADAAAARADRDDHVDALASLGQGATNPLDPKFFRFETITMVSNVSALIHGSGDPYDSIVRPGSSGNLGAYAQVYFNFNHRFDPVSIAGNFRMPAAWKILGGCDIKVDHLSGKPEDIHSAAHYLRNPRLHLPLLAYYTNTSLPDDYPALSNAFEKDCKEALTARLESRLEKIADGSSGELGKLARLIRSLQEVAA